MKALSVRQPWAWLIIHGGKDVENRTWSTSYRGRVWIHAAKGCTRDEYEDAVSLVDGLNIVKEVQLPEWLSGMRSKTVPLTWIMPPWKTITRGGIIGSVEIVDCLRLSYSPWFTGPFGFVLRDPRPAPFYPCRGSLGFFDPAVEALKVGDQ